MNWTLRATGLFCCLLIALGMASSSGPDPYEPDDDRESASLLLLGSNNSQSHTIYPQGDADWIRVRLSGSRLLRAAVSCVCDPQADDCENCEASDLEIQLFRESPNVPVAGLCNQLVDPGCLDDPQADCEFRDEIAFACNHDIDCDLDDDGAVFPQDLDDLTDPLSGFPACVTWDLFAPGSSPIDPIDNPLAFKNDPNSNDQSLIVCLPGTKASDGAPSDDAESDEPVVWFLRTTGSREGLEYQIRVDDLGPCRFESEPNDDFDRADEVAIGGTIHGFFELGETAPVGDRDLFRIDVSRGGVFAFDSMAFDPEAVDTLIELFVGPDESGEFYLFDSEDDEGQGNLARLQVPLWPACDLLGTCYQSSIDTAYYVKVTSNVVQPDFPYALNVKRLSSVLAEFQDFGDCGESGSGPQTVKRDDRVIASLAGSCDFDGYFFSLETDTHLEIKTTGGVSTDTMIQLVDCDEDPFLVGATPEVLACDDDGNVSDRCDSGYCSQIDGCLRGGRSYCVRVRPFSAGSQFDYEIEFNNRGGCTPSTPPALEFDNANGCSSPAGFDRWGGCFGSPVYDNCSYHADSFPGACCFETECLEMPGNSCEDHGGTFFPDGGCDDVYCGREEIWGESIVAEPTAIGVEVGWTTTSEVDIVGFRVVRAQGADRVADMKIVSPWIPATATGPWGASYEFLDDSKGAHAATGYLIEAVDPQGNVTRYGPVEVLRKTRERKGAGPRVRGGESGR